MKLLVEEKINQLTKNDNLKKFFNNKPMNIKALNQRVNGKWLTLGSKENNDGECSIYLKEKFRVNNIDPKNFHIVIVAANQCLYKNSIFNFLNSKPP